MYDWEAFVIYCIAEKMRLKAPALFVYILLVY
jgi:hypothetical protein